MSQVIAILLGAASPTALRPGHHPAGRILAGKTGVGAEEGAGAAGRSGRGRSRREEEAVLGTQCMPPGHSASPPWRSPESSLPLRPHSGGGGGSGVPGVQLLAPPRLGETKQNQNRFLTLPCLSAQTKNPKWRKVTFFSFQKRPFERNHRL